MPISPTSKKESHLHQQGYQNIAGIDEAGCGCWAGPLVCGVAIMPEDFSTPKLRDSKLLSAKQRDGLYDIIQSEAVAWSVGQASAQEIDQSGLTEAKSQAISRAISALSLTPDYLLCDGNISVKENIPAEVHNKGDRNIISIACASILAKVTRDRLITELGEQYPEYDFAQHKGYGTKKHQEALQKHGVSPIHRLSYKPIAKLVK